MGALTEKRRPVSSERELAVVLRGECAAAVRADCPSVMMVAVTPAGAITSLNVAINTFLKTIARGK